MIFSGDKHRGLDFNQGVERDKGRNETHYRISNENWSLAGVNKLLKKIATTGQDLRDVEHLWERLIAEWSRFDQQIIDGADNQWRQRLRACVRAESGHFEHQF